MNLEAGQQPLTDFGKVPAIGIDIAGNRPQKHTILDLV